MAEKTLIVDIKVLESLIDYEKNTEDNIDVVNISINSQTEVHWKCINGHTFKEKAGVVHRRKNKCFFCTGRQIWPGENDLQTLYPKLAKEFDAEKNGIVARQISPRDTRPYWWTCQSNHPSFKQSVSHRVERNTVCPYCSGRKVVSGQGDLETLYPKIAQEWDVEKNGGLLPSEVSPFTYNSYFWICPKGHSYKKKVVNRTRFHKQIDCPMCIKAYSTSFPEQSIYYYAKKCFPDTVNRYKEPFERGMELDIYVPFYKIGIEYDGIAFHNDEEQHERELRKYLACKKLGIKLVRVKESKDTWTDTADEIFYVKKRMKDTDLSSFLSFMFGSLFLMSKYTFTGNNNLEKCLNRCYGFPTDFDVARDRPQILEYLADVEHSFGSKYPDIAAMWAQEANGKLTPYMFTSGSNFQASWKCPKCGEIWKSPIASIVARRVKSCKRCSMKENGNTITNVKTEKYGSLAERSEILLRQWDYECNGGISPYEVPLNYSYEIAWKCDICGYKWLSSPNSRVRVEKVAGCPHCTGRVAMPGVDDLETLYPEIAKEWDYSKNEGVVPSRIRPHANKKYFWICSNCGNSYSTYPGNRVKGTGCPECARLKIRKKNSKLVGQYDDGVLVNTFQGLHEAAKAMGLATNSIFQAVKTGKKSKGYYWRYIDKDDIKL